MPRYNNVETIVFTNYQGKQFPVKDIRLISTQTVSFEIDKSETDLLDEVASRKSVYGDFGENQSWRIFDLNIVKLTENNFDVTKIRKLKISV